MSKMLPYTEDVNVLKGFTDIEKIGISFPQAIFLYRLTDRIEGEGGFGKVYRVRCVKTSKVITAYSYRCFSILMNAFLEPRAERG